MPRFSTSSRRCAVCKRAYSALLKPRNRKTCGSLCSRQLTVITHRLAVAAWHRKQRAEMGDKAWLARQRKEVAARTDPQENRERARRAYYRKRGMSVPTTKRKYTRKA